MNSHPAAFDGVPSLTDRMPNGFPEANDGWQIDQMIGANPVASLNLAIMMGVVVGWLIKRR